MATLAEYAHTYQTIRMERRDGILQITFHTNGGPLQWTGAGRARGGGCADVTGWLSAIAQRLEVR
jgi:hypothetical protein